MRKRKPITWEENENGCWVCVSHSLDIWGYAQISINNKGKRVHRYLYEEYFGEIPEGLVVRHKCDNPACINPEHLELGTHQDNVNDKLSRNRQANGSKINTSKLTKEQVLKIREEYKEIKSSRKLAKQYGVSKATILSIINRRIWKHI